MTVDSRIRRQRGVTLVELLIVLFLFGVIALIGTIQINKTWQRYRLEAAASEMRNFMQMAFTEMGRTKAPAFLRLVPVASGQPARLEIANDAAGTTVYTAYQVPDFVSLSLTDPTALDCNWPCAGAGGSCTSATDPRVLEVDSQGRALRADGVMVSAVQTLMVTHRNMVTGSLTPKTRFQLRIYPLFQTLAERGLY